MLNDDVFSVDDDVDGDKSMLKIVCKRVVYALG